MVASVVQTDPTSSSASQSTTMSSSYQSRSSVKSYSMRKEGDSYRIRSSSSPSGRVTAVSGRLGASPVSGRLGASPVSGRLGASPVSGRAGVSTASSRLGTTSASARILAQSTSGRLGTSPRVSRYDKHVTIRPRRTASADRAIPRVYQTESYSDVSVQSRGGHSLYLDGDTGNYRSSHFASSYLHPVRPSVKRTVEDVYDTRSSVRRSFMSPAKARRIRARSYEDLRYQVLPHASRSTSLNRFSYLDLEDEEPVRLRRPTSTSRLSSVSQYESRVDDSYGALYPRLSYSDLTGYDVRTGDVKVDKDLLNYKDLSATVTDSSGHFVPDDIQVRTLPSGKRALTCTRMRQSGTGDRAEANNALDRVIQRTQFMEHSMSSLEEFVRRNRSLFPEDTRIYQQYTYFMLNEQQLREIGESPDAEIYGVTIREKLVVPYGTDVTSLLGRYFKKSEVEVEYGGRRGQKVTTELEYAGQPYRRGRQIRTDTEEVDYITLQDNMRRKVEEEWEIRRQAQLARYADYQARVPTPTFEVPTHKYEVPTPKYDRPHVTPTYIRTIYEGAGAKYDDIYHRRRPRGYEPERVPEQEPRSSSEPRRSTKLKKFDSAPAFTTRLVSKRCMDKQTVRFNCAVSGLPPPEAKWFHGNKIINDGGRYRITNDHGFLTLEISDVTKNDAGLYTVKVTNDEGEVACSASLDVEGVDEGRERPDGARKPHFLFEPMNAWAEVGAKVVIEAQATGKPAPTFRWLKDNIPIEDGNRHKVYSDENGNTKLVIRDVQLADSGLYFCVAENKEGKAKCAATFRVVDQGQERPPTERATREHAPIRQVPDLPERQEMPKAGRPWFVQLPPAEISLREDEPLTIKCVIDGDPKPVVTWFKGVRELTYSKRHRILCEGQNHYLLQIPNTIQTDPGQYIVCAENPNGKCQASVWVNILPRDAEMDEDTILRTVRLQLPDMEYDVEKTKEFGKTPPRFVKKLPLETEVSSGSSFEFRCAVQDETPIEEIRTTINRKVMEGDYKLIETTHNLTKGTKEVEEIPLGIRPEGAPKILAPLSDVSVHMGGRVRLTLKVNMKVTVTWLKDGKTIEDGGRFKVITEGKTLILEVTDVTAADAGCYTVTISNDQGSASASCFLTVLEGGATDIVTTDHVKAVVESQVEQVFSDAMQEVGAKLEMRADVTTEEAETEVTINIAESAAAEIAASGDVSAETEETVEAQITLTAEAATAEVTTEEATAEETLKVEQAPTEEAPVVQEAAPVEEAPKEAPKEKVPEEKAPKEEAPVVEAPKAEAPAAPTKEEKEGYKKIGEEETTTEATTEKTGESEPSESTEATTESSEASSSAAISDKKDRAAPDTQPLIEEEKPAEIAPVKEKPTEVAPVEEKPAEVAPVEEKPTAVAPVEEKPAEVAPVKEKPAEVAPVEEKPAEVAPGEEKPAEVAPVEEKPAEVAPVEEIPAEVASVEEKPTEAAPIEEKPVEAAPAAETPVEAAPSEEKPAKEAPVEPKPKTEKAESSVSESVSESVSITETTSKTETSKPSEVSEEKPAAPAEEKPAAPAEEKPTAPAEEKPAAPAEEKPAAPAEEKPAAPAEEKPAAPAEEKPADIAPVAEKPVEADIVEKAHSPPIMAQPAEEKPVEEEPVACKPEAEEPEKPADLKPVEERPIEAAVIDEEKPAVVKPAEEKPVEEKPVEEKPVEEKPAEAKPSEDKPDKKESESEPSSVSESVSESASESTSKTESASKTESEAKPEKKPKEEPKVKKEPKEEIKEEPKEEPKEEVKAEPAEEVKAKPAEEVKAEPKEEEPSVTEESVTASETEPSKTETSEPSKPSDVEAKVTITQETVDAKVEESAEVTIERKTEVEEAAEVTIEQTVEVKAEESVEAAAETKVEESAEAEVQETIVVSGEVSAETQQTDVADAAATIVTESKVEESAEVSIEAASVDVTEKTVEVTESVTVTTETTAESSTSEVTTSEVSTSAEKPVKEKPVEKKPVEEKPAEEKPVAPAEEKPVEEKPVEPAKEKPVEEKPVQEKVEAPVEEKPTEEKPVEAKPAEEKPTETSESESSTTATSTAASTTEASTSKAEETAEAKIDVQDAAEAEATLQVKETDQAEAEATVQVRETAEAQATMQVQETAEAQATVQVEETAEAQATVQVEETAEAQATVQVEETAEAQATLQVEESAEAQATLQVEESAEVQATLQVEESAEAQATLQVEESAEAEIKVQQVEQVEVEETVEVKEAATAEEKVKVEVKVEKTKKKVKVETEDGEADTMDEVSENLESYASEVEEVEGGEELEESESTVSASSSSTESKSTETKSEEIAGTKVSFVHTAKAEEVVVETFEEAAARIGGDQVDAEEVIAAFKAAEADIQSSQTRSEEEKVEVTINVTTKTENIEMQTIEEAKKKVQEVGGKIVIRKFIIRLDGSKEELMEAEMVDGDEDLEVGRLIMLGPGENTEEALERVRCDVHNVVGIQKIVIRRVIVIRGDEPEDAILTHLKSEGVDENALARLKQEIAKVRVRTVVRRIIVTGEGFDEDLLEQLRQKLIEAAGTGKVTVSKLVLSTDDSDDDIKAKLKAESLDDQQTLIKMKGEIEKARADGLSVVMKIVIQGEGLDDAAFARIKLVIATFGGEKETRVTTRKFVVTGEETDEELTRRMEEEGLDEATMEKIRADLAYARLQSHLVRRVVIHGDGVDDDSFEKLKLRLSAVQGQGNVTVKKLVLRVDEPEENIRNTLKNENFDDARIAKMLQELTEAKGEGKTMIMKIIILGEGVKDEDFERIKEELANFGNEVEARVHRTLTRRIIIHGEGMDDEGIEKLRSALASAAGSGSITVTKLVLNVSDSVEVTENKIKAEGLDDNTVAKMKAELEEAKEDGEDRLLKIIIQGQDLDDEAFERIKTQIRNFGGESEGAVVVRKIVVRGGHGMDQETLDQIRAQLAEGCSSGKILIKRVVRDDAGDSDTDAEEEEIEVSRVTEVKEVVVKEVEGQQQEEVKEYTVDQSADSLSKEMLEGDFDSKEIVKKVNVVRETFTGEQEGTITKTTRIITTTISTGPDGSVRKETKTEVHTETQDAGDWTEDSDEDSEVETETESRSESKKGAAARGGD